VRLITSIFKNFFRGKEVEEIPLEEEISEYLDKLAVFDDEGENIAELIGNTEIYVKSIHPTCLEDISRIEKELKRGHILIVHLTRLYEKPRECMRAIEQIRGKLCWWRYGTHCRRRNFNSNSVVYSHLEK